ILKFRDTDKKLLRQTIKAQLKPSIVNDLCRFVPYRLIRPFLTQETKNIDNHQVIVEVVNQKFETLKPLYCFNSNNLKECTGIWISPDWADYLKENFAIVKGWAAWEWLKYMQAKNSTTPNIVNKLFMPQQRGSLSSQTKFWSIVLKYKSLHCIYSGQILDLKRLSLDHYLPWSFVAHDQLWNLVPVVPEVNSSKSNNLPSEKYFPEFVRLQHLALTTNHEYLPKKSWDKTIDVYVSDLNLTTDDLLNYEKLLNAYEATIKPLTTLAVKQGFPPEWVYSK
ncbi:hypothetical protein FLX56_26705, partial [Synechococcus moorigangaii CMS01]|nr:hypothetical protein [Synechococcus moorigangaii CMS01]